jgi:hypothetical protein
VRRRSRPAGVSAVTAARQKTTPAEEITLKFGDVARSPALHGYVRCGIRNAKVPADQIEKTGILLDADPVKATTK